MPFQCWVPYDLFVVSVNETDVTHGAAHTLTRLAAKV